MSSVAGRGRIPRSAVAVGERVFLRPPTRRDAAAWVEAVARSRRFHRPWAYPPDTGEQFVAWLRRSRRRDFCASLMCAVDDGRLLGTFNISQIIYGPFESAYLGYWIDRDAAGRGYMTEGMRLLLRFALPGKLRLHRLEANIQPGNTKSIALVERCGFRREGFSPRYLKIGGVWRDHQRWAILREDVT